MLHTCNIVLKCNKGGLLMTTNKEILKMDNETFGEYISRIRKLKSLSQRKLGILSGLSNTTINRIENDTNIKPDIMTLKTLAKCLNIDEIHFLKASGYIDDNTTSVHENTEAWNTFKNILVDKGIIKEDEQPSPELMERIIDTFKIAIEMSKKMNTL